MATQSTPTPARDDKGRFVETDPPLVVVNNPVTTLKKWWKKVIGNEGIDFRLTIHPLTAIAIASTIALGSFGLGRISLPKDNPIVRYLPQLAPAPTPDPWRVTAYTGTLRYTVTSRTFYLATEKAEAITLSVPADVQLLPLVGKRIFAAGRLNTDTGILFIAEATDLEILPNKIIYPPGVSPKPSPLSSPSPEPTPQPTPFPNPTPIEPVEY